MASMGTHFRGSAAEIRALDAYIKLMRASGTLSETAREGIRAEGFNENQFGVLETLFHLGPLSQYVLGAKLFTSRPNVTLVVDQLELKGLVSRHRSTKDRRSVNVHLTPAGRRRIEKIFPRHAALIADLFEGLSAAEQEELGRLCKKLGLTAAGSRVRNGVPLIPRRPKGSPRPTTEQVNRLRDEV
jgi:MarR family 2-MHQ and catechol resistance regulon transcriptional repressor